MPRAQPGLTLLPGPPLKGRHLPHWCCASQRCVLPPCSLPARDLPDVSPTAPTPLAPHPDLPPCCKVWAADLDDIDNTILKLLKYQQDPGPWVGPSSSPNVRASAGTPVPAACALWPAWGSCAWTRAGRCRVHRMLRAVWSSWSVGDELISTLRTVMLQTWAACLEITQTGALLPAPAAAAPPTVAAPCPPPASWPAPAALPASGTRPAPLAACPGLRLPLQLWRCCLLLRLEGLNWLVCRHSRRLQGRHAEDALQSRVQETNRAESGGGACSRWAGQGGACPVLCPANAPDAPPPALPRPCMQSFYECAVGGIFAWKQCPPGLLFSEKGAICDWPTSVTCTATAPQSSPPPLSSPTQPPSPPPPSPRPAPSPPVQRPPPPDLRPSPPPPVQRPQPPSPPPPVQRPQPPSPPPPTQNTSLPGARSPPVALIPRPQKPVRTCRLTSRRRREAPPPLRQTG